MVSVTPSGNQRAEPTGSIKIEFSEKLDPKTVTSKTIVLSDNGKPVPGKLEYSGVTVTFTPDERLDLLGSYKLEVTTGVKDAGGTAMEEPYETTILVRDGVWSEEFAIEHTEGMVFSRLVSPAIDAYGNVIVVWGQEGTDRYVFSVWGRFYRLGEGWSAPFEIDKTDDDCENMSVAMNAKGDAVVAWSEVVEGKFQVKARRYVDGSWEDEPKRVDGVTAATSHFVVTAAMSPTGEAHVLWNYRLNNMDSIDGAHAKGTGAWSTPVTIGHASYLDRPAVAFNPDGNGFAFFYQQSSNDSSSLVAVRYLPGDNWQSTNIIENTEDTLRREVSAVADDNGGAYALSVRQNVGTNAYEIVSTRFTKANGFSPATVLLSLPAQPASVPQLASNGKDRIGSWSRFANLTDNAYSVLSDGADYGPEELRSNGDYSVNYGDVVPGIDRRGNGLLLFAQDASNDDDGPNVMFARLAGGEWSAAKRLNQKVAQYQDPRVAVAANGVAVAVWSRGIRRNAGSIFVSVFE